MFNSLLVSVEVNSLVLNLSAFHIHDCLDILRHPD